MLMHRINLLVRGHKRSAEQQKPSRSTSSGVDFVNQNVFASEVKQIVHFRFHRKAKLSNTSRQAVRSWLLEYFGFDQKVMGGVAKT